MNFFTPTQIRHLTLDQVEVTAWHRPYDAKTVRGSPSRSGTSAFSTRFRS